MGRTGEELCGESEDDPGGGGEQHRDRHQRDDLVDGVERVVDVPGAGDIISRKGGQEAGKERVVADSTDGEDLQAEDGASAGRVEDEGETRADAGNQKSAAIFSAQGEPRDAAEQPVDLVGDRRAGLDGGAFAPT